MIAGLAASAMGAEGGPVELHVETTTEEARLPAVRSGSRVTFEPLAEAVLEHGIPEDPATAGHTLWRRAVLNVHSGVMDDRPLYWARLAVRAAMRARPSAELAAFEWSSRGMDDVEFAPEVAYRVLITGFDPFGLADHLDQSNPSGLAVLALDGRVLETARGDLQIQGALMPVRFADFDAGLIESFLEPHLAGGGLDLVITLSMGRDAFDLERFPGRRRSAAVPDNLNVRTGASGTKPLIPGLRGAPLAGPEFLEFSLPAEAMTGVDVPFAVRDNRSVSTLERGEVVAASLAELNGLTAVAGSGGGYLSNEIGYRSLLANLRSGAGIPMGHLHTPRVSGYDAETERQVVEQIRALIVAAVEALPAR